MPPHRQPSISTHVLDTERGRPAVGVRVTLERHDGAGFVLLADATTDDDGRIGALLPPGTLSAGVYRIAFDVAGYVSRQAGDPPFFRAASFEIEIADTSRPYHVPLLMTRYACSTYRGS